MKRNEKNNSEEKPKRNFNKRFIFVALFAFLFSFAVGFYIYGRGEKEPLVMETYVIEEDSVSSVATKAPTEVLTKILPSQQEGVNYIQYIYEWGENSQTALEEYEKYLEEEGFVSLEEENESQILADLESQNETENTRLFYMGTESKEEGKLFEIAASQGQNSYTVTVFREEGKLPEEPGFTRDQAKSFLQGFLDEKKELTLPFENYTCIFDVGRTFIQNEECYGVSIYQKGQSECNEIVGKYFVSLKDKNVYKYNLQTGESVKISN